MGYKKTSLTLPSTIVPSALDSKPLRDFSPVMAGVIRYERN